MNKDHENVYNNIELEVIRSSRNLIKFGLENPETPVEDKLYYIENWIEELSEVYQIESPKVVFEDNQERKEKYGSCFYSYSAKKLFIFCEFTALELFKSFRLHMQNSENGKFELYRDGIADDDIDWSSSLLKRALPVTN